MSGGPFGRGKAPERRCMPLEEWPDPDRAAWQAATEPADIFAVHGGERADYRTHSNDKTAKGYGRWLTFLKLVFGHDVLLELPGDRITRDRTIAYVDQLLVLRNKSSTILNRVQELGDMAKTLAPGRDWSFIAKIASKVRARPVAPNHKRARLETSDKLLGLGLSLMETAEGQSTARKRAVDYRDGLMIALLSLCPLRRGNFMGLTLGNSLRQIKDEWWIMISGDQAKCHAPLEYPWPKLLLAPLKHYIHVHRPILASRTHKGASKIKNQLWASETGSALTEMSFFCVVQMRTKAAFGRAINPHLFRDAAATSMAIYDPQHVRLAAPLLGHRSLSTTEKYYQQALSIEASRDFGATLMRLRNDELGHEGRSQ
jgi:integrase/recombinase XerD